ncbi:MAG: ABC transporter ATP-binding protein/permease [Desulfobulbaceae bacterium]|nr:ABC transporter ATP-binding protein/permease [Desulfobulbaceae bacterium]
MKLLLEAYVLIQRIPNATVLLFLILAAGLAEGIGLSALVPVLSTLTGDFSGGDLPVPFNLLPEGMLMLGIEPSFGAMLLFALLVMLTAYLLVHIQDRAVVRARYRFLEDIRNRASEAIFSSRWEHLSGLSSGSVANIVIHESERGAEGLMALMTMLAIFVQLMVYGLFAFLLSWQMFLVAFVSVMFSVLTARRLIRLVRMMGKQSVEIDAKYSRQFVDFIRGAKLIKATDIVSSTVDTLYISNTGGCLAKRNIVINQSLMRFELQAIISVIMVGILYMAIIVLKVPVSVLLVFMFIIMRLAPRFTSLQGQYYNYSAYRPALEVVDSLIRDGCDMAEKDHAGSRNFIDFRDGLSLDNVTYKYFGAETEALKEVSLTVGAREFVALVGRSGSGKSTALDLLMGLIEPKEGQVLVDGGDLREFDISTFRKRMGFVSQESIFFVGTIRENLCLGIDVEGKEQHVWECLRIAQIDDFVRKLPDALDTEVGEAGVKLSGGQRQRLAIARALIRRPALLILDEATSALDSESEASFQKAIEVVAHDYTMVVVAHRLSTIKKAQRIYVFDEGHLVQEGDYNSMITTAGPFSELVKAQTFGLD